MASLAKRAISESFLKLLSEKPYNQITVKDIVDDCGVNRNTFYYHFHDLEALVQSIIDDELARVVNEHPDAACIEHYFEAVIRFALAHRQAALHLYYSINRDIYEDYLWKASDVLVRDYLDKAIGARHISDDDRELLVDYYRALFVGLSLALMNSGLHPKSLARFERLWELQKDEAQRMIDACEKSES